MTPTEYVCELCGCALYRTTRGNWKHQTGGPVMSCGRKPRPRLRGEYEREIRQIIEEVRRQRG